MKKLIIIVGLVALGLGLFTNKIYEKYFQGIWPAILPPTVNTSSPGSNKPSQHPPQTAPENQTGLPLTLPKGFNIKILAKGLGNARAMAFDPKGNLLVSLTQQGEVAVITRQDNKIIQLIGKIDRPHGLALKCQNENCKLYVAAVQKLMVYDYNPDTLQVTNPKKLATLPPPGRHFTRTLQFLPPPNDHKLLISIGSTCDVCHEQDPQHGAIYMINDDGADFKSYATGLRNSVFMTMNPKTNQVWATEMGRDWLGDDLPPDELNIIQEGKNYGWPICYGQNIHDDQFDKRQYIRNPCMLPFETPSQIDLPAHSAPLGLTFVPQDKCWPAEYQNNLLVSFHGSWNRSVPTGYKVERLILDENQKLSKAEDFISGWLAGNTQAALGRPVDLAFNQGSLYISDDKAGAIYQVTPTACLNNK